VDEAWEMPRQYNDSSRRGSVNDLLSGSIAQLLIAYRTRKTSPVEVCEALIDTINRHDSRIGAFLRLDREGAMKAARDAEQNPGKPLSGVPVAIKDNICTRGLETTCSSKILQGYVPPYDATVVDRLKKAGAIILGKTNCDEFAMGSSTENSAYQLTRNPWNTDYAPGGSSGTLPQASLRLARWPAPAVQSVNRLGLRCHRIELTYGRVTMN
jgi:aspartyl-tRNA(Asn)/glutamyl-tRNA(Gln) amidotransferase subunit A